MWDICGNYYARVSHARRRPPPTGATSFADVFADGIVPSTLQVPYCVLQPLATDRTALQDTRLAAGAGMAGPGEPLALDYAAFGQAGGARRGEDSSTRCRTWTRCRPDTKRSVEQLIEEEMRRSSKRPADYLKELPEVPESVIPEDSLIMAELARLKAGEPMAQREHQELRLMNLELQVKYGAAVWRAHNQHLDLLVK
eukprot:jgi/Tetstr1/433613/TSEL_022878.t1